MLRALAGYFFGGPNEEVPQEPMECETKEVNDWLVVNMPDQPEDDIDFVEVDDDEDEMQTEELDEILCCLSNWFAPTAELDNDTNLEGRMVEPSSLPRIRLLFTRDDSPNEDQCLTINLPERMDTVPRPHWSNWWQMLPLQMRFRQNALVGRRPVDVVPTDAFWLDHQAAYDCLSGGKQKARELFQRLKERSAKKAIKSSDVTCHPIYSKTYVNHRHPASSPQKTDLLQKIKELEPEQRAAQHAMKKHNSRGQLNRQNKNYIYDTSTKKNRRKNLQRNPSGANNNRKCCY